MQLKDDDQYERRALYYWDRLYSDQLTKGKNYQNLKKSIGIHLLNFTCLSDIKKYHNVFQMREKDSQKHYFKDIEIHIIELNKFSDQVEENLNILLKKLKNSKNIILKI